MTTKRCTKCKEEKPLSEFHKGKRYKNGVVSQCKKCTNEKAKRWAAKNRKKDRENQRELYNKYKKKGCSRCGKPTLPSQSKCENHYLADVAHSAFGKSTLENIERLKQLLIDQNYKCVYTGEQLILGVNAHLDHKYPKSRFPELSQDLNNVHWVLDKMNRIKHTQTHEEFIDYLRGIVELHS